MAGTLSQKLIPRLLARFPGRGVCLHQSRQPVVAFPAAHPEVGDLQIHDDEEELTISVGQLTQDTSRRTTTRRLWKRGGEEIINRVMELLDAVFNDRMEFWRTGKRGGWTPRGDDLIMRRLDARRYVWSGPVANQ